MNTCLSSVYMSSMWCVVFMNTFRCLYCHNAINRYKEEKSLGMLHCADVFDKDVLADHSFTPTEQRCNQTFISSASLPFRPALGGLLSSSYRQHQESLAAERERRRVEREERLQRIEREERNKHRWGIAGFVFKKSSLKWQSMLYKNDI